MRRDWRTSRERRRHGPRRPALPEGLQRIRRRLGRAARRRPPRRRGRVEHSDQGPRARPADGVPRAVHALHSVHRPARRRVALSGPGELDGHPLRDAIRRGDERRVRDLRAMDRSDARLVRAALSEGGGDSDAVYRSAIRAKALDTLRGLLPAATQSNVGIYGTGQAYETLLLRMRAHPLMEVRATADAMLAELRKIIPAFLTRVDQPDRGGRWTEYLAETRARMAELAARVDVDARATDAPDRRLRSRSRTSIRTARSRSSPRPSTRRRRCRMSQLLDVARRMTPAEREQVLRAAVGSDRTAATSPAARSSARAIASTSSPTTARSAICSAIAC